MMNSDYCNKKAGDDKMARFNLGARMEEVEASMCEGENCSIINGNDKNTKAVKDNEVLFFEDDGDMRMLSEKNKNSIF